MNLNLKKNQKLKIQDHFEKELPFFFDKQIAKTMFIINLIVYYYFNEPLGSCKGQ